MAKGGTTQLSPSLWRDKQNVVNVYNEMLFSHKDEENSDTCYNMGESWIYYAKWKRTSTVLFLSQTTNIVLFPLYEVPGIGKFIETESKMMVTKDWGSGDGKLLLIGYRVSVRVDEKVLEIVVTAAQHCEGT